MEIKLCSIYVDDQAKALSFYTDVLGFVLINDVPASEFRWLTVGSADQPGLELVLEPNIHPAATAYQEALFKEGIPATALFTQDMDEEYKQLLGKGVTFQAEPVSIPGGPKLAVFNDTCGNWIQLVQG